MPRFHDQTVLITGATGGMGSSHVRAFHAEGANVVVADRDPDRAERFAKQLGQRALVVPLDVTDPLAWAAAVSTVEASFGPISVLINNAGIQHEAATIETTSLPTWERTMAVNVTGQFLGIQAVTPSLRRAGGGSIVNIGSTMAHGGTAYYAPYVASKWAMRGLTKTAALELGRDGIRVNAIHPGVVATPLIDSPVGPGLPTIGQLFSAEPYAVPRLGDPSDVTSLVLYLSSHEASFVTGSEFVVDGGLLLGPALQPA